MTRLLFIASEKNVFLILFITFESGDPKSNDNYDCVIVK